MVRDANVKQAASEKQLKEAQGKVCEVSLKKKKIKTVKNRNLSWIRTVFFHIVEGHKIASNYQYLIFFCVWLADWCSASRSDGTQDSGVDVHTFFTKSPAASTAAVFRYQGIVQIAHPEQERQRCISTLTCKKRSFHSACVQRGPRGKLKFIQLSLLSFRCASICVPLYFPFLFPVTFITFLFSLLSANPSDLFFLSLSGVSSSLSLLLLPSSLWSSVWYLASLSVWPMTLNGKNR